ncbi:hypothetical protein D0Y56_28200 [Pseudomonas aeruginosa]|nr:hypothetical protein D0Y56_28200 [Pseudomonas aeruginosa]
MALALWERREVHQRQQDRQHILNTHVPVTPDAVAISVFEDGDEIEHRGVTDDPVEFSPVIPPGRKEALSKPLGVSGIALSRIECAVGLSVEGFDRTGSAVLEVNEIGSAQLAVLSSQKHVLSADIAKGRRSYSLLAIVINGLAICVFIALGIQGFECVTV